MHPELAGDGDIEITRAQNRNYLLGEGFHRMASKSNSWSLFLRYHAQAERHYRRAVEEFERLRRLRSKPQRTNSSSHACSMRRVASSGARGPGRRCSRNGGARAALPTPFANMTCASAARTGMTIVQRMRRAVPSSLRSPMRDIRSPLFVRYILVDITIRTRDRPCNPSGVTHRYARMCAKIGIDSHLHALRHYSATELLTAGVDLRTVAGRLGHAGGGATTLRVYAAWVGESDRRAAEILGGRLRRPK